MHLDDVLTELVADSGDRLLQVAYQLTHDRGAAQDLVQDALLRVYRSVRRRGLAPEDWYAYLFSYPEGPLVSVEIAVGCYPEVGGLYFQSHSASSVVPIIQQLLRAK